MPYDQRIVAFIDVLGFQDLVAETVDSGGKEIEQKIKALAAAYDTIHEVWKRDAAEQKREVTIFSDSVVISFESESENAALITLAEIKIMICELLQRGILCRGAITFGKLLHNPRYIFGPALIEAYLLESRAALYPRVILDRHTFVAAGFHEAKRLREQKNLEFARSVVKRDSDGMYYIDYFCTSFKEVENVKYFKKCTDSVGEIIRKGLMGSAHQSRAHVRVKYLWMREKFNRMVEAAQEPNCISEMRASGKDAVADYYLSLKKISPARFDRR